MIRSAANSLFRHRKGFRVSDSVIGNPSDGVLVETKSTQIETPVVVGSERIEEGIRNPVDLDSVRGDFEIVVVEESRIAVNDRPPMDDVCAICFGEFKIPFKTNCGHWFCGSCFLQFWSYNSSLQKCKCPICSQLVSKLTPDACLLMLHDKEATDVIKDVQKYNRLFQGGVRGLLQNVLAVPLLIKRLFLGMMDPDRFTDNYHTARFIGLMLGVLYRISSFDFIPTGRYAAHSFFELCATGLAVILCLVGLFYRAFRLRRMRRMAAAHF